MPIYPFYLGLSGHLYRYRCKVSDLQGAPNMGSFALECGFALLEESHSAFHRVLARSGHALPLCLRKHYFVYRSVESGGDIPFHGAQSQCGAIGELFRQCP